MLTSIHIPLTHKTSKEICFWERNSNNLQLHRFLSGRSLWARILILQPKQICSIMVSRAKLKKNLQTSLIYSKNESKWIEYRYRISIPFKSALSFSSNFLFLKLWAIYWLFARVHLLYFPVHYILLHFKLQTAIITQILGIFTRVVSREHQWGRAFFDFVYWIFWLNFCL